MGGWALLSYHNETAMRAQYIIFIALVAFGHSVTESRQITEPIQLDNGLSRGSWGPPDLCADDSLAVGFELKYEDLGHLDDTGVNAIRLYCEKPSGELTNIVSSVEGLWGNWKGIRNCKKGEYLVGMRGNVVKEQGMFGDDMGLDNLQMKCSDNTTLDGLHHEPLPEHKDLSLDRERVIRNGQEMEAVHVVINHEERTGDHGDWGSWTECSSGLKICGIEIRLEHTSPVDDDAGVTDAIMFCCTA